MRANVFLDTNILVYAIESGGPAPAKTADNPQLRSMLLLAGVNQWQPDQAVFYRLGGELLNEGQARARCFSQAQFETNRIEVAAFA